MIFIKPLSELGATDLHLAGGKAANLGALMHAGFPVPPGFCITTDGFRTFVSANNLQPEILRLSNSIQDDDIASLETISTQIRALFITGVIPDDLAVQIRSSYAALADQSRAVAVRSSATAEDLADLSFAGQQDTYLNTIGEEAVLEAVKHCWSSLWTARAIGYRFRNHIHPPGLALAVIVQQMVSSDASGVLFSANPLTGKRTETVIDATYGLGEALVSGQVDPDHYVVDTRSRRIIDKTLGAKSISVRATPGGGTVTVAEGGAERQALPDAQIIELASLGERAAHYLNAPQDIEWAWADGHLYVVQSRPITSLFPLPSLPANETDLRVWFSFGVWQGMLDPFTPLGQDIFASFIVGIANRIGLPVTIETQRVLVQAGERLYVDITPLIRHKIGRQVVRQFVAAIDPASSEILETITSDTHLTIQSSRIKFGALLHLAPLLMPLAFNVLYNLAQPARGRARLQQWIDHSIHAFDQHRSSTSTLAECIALIESDVASSPSEWLDILLPAVISGQVALQSLLRLSAGVPGGTALVMELTRGLPHNVTTEMDLALWDAARAIKTDSSAVRIFEQTAAAALAAKYKAGVMPTVAQTALDDFIQQYGARGIGEIDIGRPRWNEDPTHLIQVLKSYMQIAASDSSPEAIFHHGAAQAVEAGQQLLHALRQTQWGWFKARLARLQINRVRELVGLRESPKFAVIRLFDIFRQMLLESGRKLASEGRLTQGDDLFFLHLQELPALAADGKRDWPALITERRQRYNREMQRRQLPRLLLSDGTAYYDGMPAAAGAGIIVGSPVSAGIVEGVVHVVLDPQRVHLQPGEILVCPATDPAWTPLFLTAGGLVMEVGGMMSHGSVVAREYGIPAVVGVSQATTRLKTGQRIRVNGSTGQIVILDT